MNQIVKLIPNLKIFYLALIILTMIIINIILNKSKINSNYKYLINGISLIILATISNYLNDIIDSIFNLDFISVKLYIIILIIINIITLITIYKNLKIPYKLINYLLFGIITLILSLIIILLVGINLNLLPTTINEYIIILINLSIIVFIVYLTIISLIYIIKIQYSKPTNLNNINKEKQYSLTDKELLSITNKQDFTIHGVNCSIIFEDSIKTNIIKNYHTLVHDINAKLTNGYTLKENILLKNICTKLKTNNLNNIDLNNLSILNKINAEEYNLLKKINEE